MPKRHSEPSPTPSQAPKTVADSPEPSALARARALDMRRFDPKLSDDALATIARGIDANARVGEALNPKKRRLGNGDEPVTAFAVRA